MTPQPWPDVPAQITGWVDDVRAFGRRATMDGAGDRDEGGPTAAPTPPSGPWEGPVR
jgi:hypothetical protein